MDDIDPRIEGKLYIQKLARESTKKLPHGDMIEVGAVVWNVVHDAYNKGIEVGTTIDVKIRNEVIRILFEHMNKDVRNSLPDWVLEYDR